MSRRRLLIVMCGVMFAIPSAIVRAANTLSPCNTLYSLEQFYFPEDGFHKADVYLRIAALELLEMGKIENHAIRIVESYVEGEILTTAPELRPYLAGLEAYTHVSEIIGRLRSMEARLGVESDLGTPFENGSRENLFRDEAAALRINSFTQSLKRGFQNIINLNFLYGRREKFKDAHELAYRLEGLPARDRLMVLENSLRKTAVLAWDEIFILLSVLPESARPSGLDYLARFEPFGIDNYSLRWLVDLYKDNHERIGPEITQALRRSGPFRIRRSEFLSLAGTKEGREILHFAMEHLQAKFVVRLGYFPTPLSAKMIEKHRKDE